MTVAGLFYIPAGGPDSSSAQEIIVRLSRTYNIIPLPTWTLSHRLFRETPSQDQSRVHQSSPAIDGSDKSKSTGSRHLQILSVSYPAPKTYVTIQAPLHSQQTPDDTIVSDDEEPAVMISIPSGSQSEDFIQLVISKFGPLWQQRPMVNIINGYACEVGSEFRVRVGEIKQGIGAPPQTGKGAVCEIEWLGLETGDKNWHTAEAVIKGFWRALGIIGAKELLLVPGLDPDECRMRQWCEVLRIRF